MAGSLEGADPAKLAHEVWLKNYKINLIKEAGEPRLYVMSGLPLSGKTHLAQRIIDRSSASVVYIENDLVRRMIVSHLGLGEPVYTPEEHKLVFDVSHELIWLALSFSFHTLFDATNLNERHRQKIYEIADAAGADVLVIKLVVDRKVAEERALQKFQKSDRKDHSQADLSIYDKLRQEDEPIEHCTRQYIIVDTTNRDIDSIIDECNLLLE